ncbi:MAG: RNA polymerase factor sigma-54 [Akkermansia sp.]|nr:RNA polymerase factor sigma-54 [Akkermansia sp.]
MAATAAVQMFMRALQANNAELNELATQALAGNPALEELPPLREEDTSGQGSSPNRDATQRHARFLESLTEQITLGAHLEEQIRRSALPPETEAAALAIIPYLNHHGFFAEPPQQVENELGLDATVFRRALRAIQDLEPAGVGATDLRESLILQLQRRGERGGIPMQLLRHHWDDLVRHRYAEAARALDVEEEAVALAARRIARLNPDPGSGFARTELQIITPDVVVEEEEGKLNVSLTEEGIPRLALSASYREMLSERADNPELRAYLSRCFREGRELIRAIHDRQQTILSVARTIVEQQKAFFLRGPEYLVPLRMDRVATELGISTSTVSRAVRGKYLRCAHGVFELRRFFTSAVSETESAGSVQARIRQLVADEDPGKPLSDAAMAELLEQEGIPIARRTIAKYREQLRILPASLRRKK